MWATAPQRFYLPPIYHQVAEVIGWDHAVDLGCYVAEFKRPPSRRKKEARHSGSGTLYVRRDCGGRVMQAIASVIGWDATASLAQAFGGESLEFCGIERAFLAGRNRAIVERFTYGYSARDVAASFGITDRQVRRICQDESGRLISNTAAALKLREARLRGVREAVLLAAADGESIEDAAREWGFAPDVARAIIVQDDGDKSWGR